MTLGEALAVLVPSDPVDLDEAGSLKLLVGGAELNFAVGICRLGREAVWIGRLGRDPLGRLVRRSLREEGVDVRWVRDDDEGNTGLYLREWVTDGARRPYYYRQGSAANHLAPSDWPSERLGDVAWLHATGITAALGASPRRALAHAMRWGRARGIPVSFDPNFRPALWECGRVRDTLMEFAVDSDVLLLSEEDAHVLFATAEPGAVIAAAHRLGIGTVVLKLGASGAIGSHGGEPVVSPAWQTGAVVDTVGAGDGFNAGFVAGLMASGDLAQALSLGNYVGARAVEHVDDHPYPRLADLPDDLRAVLEPASRGSG